MSGQGFRFGGWRGIRGKMFGGRRSSRRPLRLEQLEDRQLLNAAPTIAPLHDITTDEDVTVGPITLDVHDAETPTEYLVLGYQSSNPDLLSIQLSHFSSAPTLKVVPNANVSGMADVFVSVTDEEGATTWTGFRVTVMPVNDLPTISTIGAATTPEDTPWGPTTFQVGDVETPPENLLVTCSFDNPGLASVALQGSGAWWSVSAVPLPNVSGFGNVHIVATDADGGSASLTFKLTVTAVNDPPTIDGLVDLTVNEDSQTPVISFQVGDVETAADNLIVTATTSNATVIPTQNIVLAGSGKDRTVQITPAANQSGTVTVTLAVSDADAKSSSKAITVTVNPVEDYPQISSINDRRAYLGVKPDPIKFTIGDAETAATSLTLAATSDNSFLLPSTGIVLGGTGANRTLTLTPAAGLIGTATVTIKVTDAANLVTQQQFRFSVITETTGLYSPQQGIFYLRDEFRPGAADTYFPFGAPGLGWQPLAGDWNGDGQATVGFYDPKSSVFYLKNSHAGGDADITFVFGVGGLGWQPVVGDWNRDGVDTVGLYDPSTGRFFLQDAHVGGAAKISVAYGVGGSGWQPLVGDWNGDGFDSLGLYDPKTGIFYLKDNLPDTLQNIDKVKVVSGNADAIFGFGVGGLGWQPLVGNWDLQGGDTLGFYVPSSGIFFLKNTLGGGNADIAFQYGQQQKPDQDPDTYHEWLAVTGLWHVPGEIIPGIASAPPADADKITAAADAALASLAAAPSATGAEDDALFGTLAGVGRRRKA